MQERAKKLECYERAVKSGLARAQLVLGRYVLKHATCEAETAKGLCLLTNAADGGDGDAQ